MWRYLPGVRRLSSPTTTASSKRSLSSSILQDSCPLENSRNFVPSRKDNYSWLEYDSSSGKMFCTLCRKHKKKNAFSTSGSTKFRRSALTDHSKSLEHTDAVCATHKSKQAFPIFASAIESADKAILTLLKAVYFIAKEDIAILKYLELLNLLESCSSPNLPRELYRNRDACHKFITLIGESIESELGDEMRDSPYLGFMVNESTDQSIRKNLLLYVNRAGDVNSYFAHIDELNQCDAPAVTEANIRYLEVQKH
uniref:C17orf113 probable zinc finger domain-containing protein n=1 Tax=Amphimedon queenslandica TaxID=400682 RepID=A0A1X7VE37_AMPQE